MADEISNNEVHRNSSSPSELTEGAGISSEAQTDETAHSALPETLPIPPETGQPVLEPLSFYIAPTSDRMALLLTVNLPAGRLDELLQLARTKLQSMGIHDGRKLKFAEESIQNAARLQEDLKDVVILEGTPPIPPEDGAIVWAGNFFEEGFVVVDKERDQVDYRLHIANKSVGKGQMLATLSPPREGEPGLDVFGKVVKTRPARPARLRAGKNVDYIEEEDAYYAAIEGRIRFIGGTVHVDDVFTINGSVGLETGNINHPGALIITKDIESDAKVEVEGDIEVYGNVENAVVHSGGGLYVHGGITGGDACRIRISGDLKAKFIQNADIEAEGNISVQREIDKSFVRTRGMLFAGSRIVGGELQALGGIEADQIGSEGCVRTSLIAGEDYLLARELSRLDEELAQKNETLSKISGRLDPLKNRPVTLSPKLQEVVRLLNDESERLQAAIIRIDEEIAAIRTESKERAKREILAKKIIYPETSYQIMSLTLVVREEISGPVKVALHDGDIHVMETRLFR